MIKDFAEQSRIQYGECRQRFQRHFATVELAPYHSLSSALPPRLLEKLKSVKLARSFVHDVLIPRAHAGDCLIVVTRAAKQWGVPEHEHVTMYNAAEAQSCRTLRQTAAEERLFLPFSVASIKGARHNDGTG